MREEVNTYNIKKDLEVIESKRRKCDRPFRLQEKSVKGNEGWIVKLLCAYHNHDLTDTLVGHPYIGRLTLNEKSMFVDMKKSSVKPINILLTMHEHNDKNVTTIKQVYNVMIVYQRSK